MKYTSIIIIISAALSINGCSIFTSKTPAEPVTAPPQTQSEKFIQPDIKGPTAVESAIIWSDKYTKLSEQMEQLQKKNMDLTQENHDLANQLNNKQVQLEQAKKELTEANALLVDMQKELTNWKTDVLGFRDEMRKAQRAQIEALTHIVVLLGGEPSTAAADANNSKHVESKTDEPNKSK